MKLIRNKRASLLVRIFVWGVASWFIAEVYLPGTPRVIVPTVYPVIAHVTFKPEWADYRERTDGLPLPLMFSGTISPQDAMDRMHNQIGYGYDEEIFGKKEYYATPTEIALASRGDCDDFATVWYHMLIEQGFDHVGVAIGYIDDNINYGHAVTLVKIEGTTYVLDVNEYEPIEVRTWLNTWEAKLFWVGNSEGLHAFEGWLTL